MNIDQIQSILGAEIECGIFESVVVPALDVCRKVAASGAATGSDAASVGSDFRDESILSWLRNLRGTGGCNAAAIEHIEELYERLAATVGDAAGVALTDERIIDIWCNTPTTRFGGEVEDQEIIDFARAILAASSAATGSDAATAGTQDELAFISDVAAQKPEKPDHWNTCGQCEHNIERAQELIEARAQSTNGEQS